MKIQELKAGTELVLEIVWGDSSYEIPSKIVLSMAGRVFLQSFTYKGATLDLENPTFRGMSFNIYANDGTSGQRLMWRSIGLETREVKGKIYYEIKTNAFSAESRESERRETSRVRIGVPGIVMVPELEMDVPVEIYDFSRDGIAFLTKEELRIVGSMVTVHFTEQVREHAFEVNVNAHCVRKKEGERTLYGCHIRSMDTEAIAYLTQKTMEVQMEALEAQRKATENQALDGPVGDGASILQMGQ